MDERLIGAGTTVRFVLLMVLLVVASGSMMRDVLGGISGSDSMGCLLAGGADPDGSILQVQLVLLQQTPAYDECMARFHPPPPWWMVLGWPVVVLLGAIVLFRVLPAWRTRSRWVKPLDETHDARGLVAETVAIAGLVRTPRLVVDPTSGAAVYGSNRRPTLRLSAELLALATTDPERFRGVVLHELAHIRNGDVTLHHLTAALWRVFLGAVLLPYAVWAVVAMVQPSWWSADHPLAVRQVLLVVVLVVLVYLARADVLRSREVCADLVASRWGASHRTWDVTTPEPARRWLASFTELWRTHPRLDLRRAAVAGAGELFGLRALPVFLTGVAATLINTQLVSYLRSSLAVEGVVRDWVGQALLLVPSGLVVGVVGIALWRAVVHSVLTSAPAPSGARIGLWLGFGLAAGELFLHRVSVTEWLPPQPELLVLLVLAGVAITWWIGQCAHLWATVRRAARPAMVAALGAAWLALASWFAWWQSSGTIHALLGLLVDTSQVRDVLQAGMGELAAGQAPVVSALASVLSVLTGLYDPVLAMLAVSALWIVPLLAWTVRPAGDTAVPPLRRALLPGLTGGALAGAAVMALQAHQHTRLPLPPGSGPFFVLTFQTSVLAIVVLGTVVSAFAAALWAGRYRLLVALISAETAVVTGFAWALTTTSVDGCVEPLRMTADRTCRVHFAMSGFVVQYTLVPAVVAAAVAAVVFAGAVSAFRRTPALPSPSSTLALRRCAVAVLCVAAATISVAGVVLWSQRHREANDAEAADLLPPPAAVPVAARTRAAQLYAWNRYGGKELNQRLLNTLKRHAALLSELGSGTGTVDVSPLRPTCAEFGQIARDAERYFRIPDTVAQQHWSRYVELAKQSSTHCLDALDHGPERLLVQSSEELTDAVSAANSALSRLEQITNG